MQLRKRFLLKTSLIAVPLSLAVAAAAYAGKANCWMTGGGSVFRDNGGGEVVVTGPKIGRVTHGFELRCEGRPNNLEINWDGNRFHLEQLTSAVCTDSPLIVPNPPDAEFDTFTGTGNGRYNGTSGATIEFVFTDAGEGGSGDTADILIRDAGGATLLEVSGFLTFGNHQAHSS
jgi:hypothetical protein